jgi:hypothetical protein
MAAQISILARCIAIATLLLASTSGCGLHSHSDAAGALADIKAMSARFR